MGPSCIEWKMLVTEAPARCSSRVHPVQLYCCSVPVKPSSVRTHQPQLNAHRRKRTDPCPGVHAHQHNDANSHTNCIGRIQSSTDVGRAGKSALFVTIIVHKLITDVQERVRVREKVHKQTNQGRAMDLFLQYRRYRNLSTQKYTHVCKNGQV